MKTNIATNRIAGFHRAGLGALLGILVSVNAFASEPTAVDGPKPPAAAEPAAEGTATPVDKTQDDPFMLDRIIVTASRVPTTVGDASQSVTVIDRDAIQSELPVYADDLLKTVPGVDVLRRSGMTSSTSTVTLRGFGGQARGRTLVLVDGIPFNEIYSGEVYWNSVPVGILDRIEVVPGPGSGLYGPGAMGGVINMITQKPEKFSLKVDSAWESYATKSLFVAHQNKVGNFGYSVAWNGFSTGGYVAATDRQFYDIRRDNENFTTDLKLYYDLTKTSTVTAGYRHYDEHANGGRQFYSGDKNTDRAYAGLDLWLGEKLQVQGNIYLDRDISNWTYDLYTTRAASRYQSIDYVNDNPKQGLGGNVQANLHWPDWSIITAGMDWRWGKINSQDAYRSTTRWAAAQGQQKLVGFYLQEEAKLWEKLIFTAGGRVDCWWNYDGAVYDTTLNPKQTLYNKYHETSFNPKVGVLYHLFKDTALRSTFGKSFRVPTLYDLYRTWKYGTTTYRSNPTLSPEWAYSFEAGVEQTLWKKILGRLTFYYNDIHDLIYSVDTLKTRTATIKDKQNVGRATSYGLETEVRVSATKEWSLFWNNTYDMSQVKKNSLTSLEGKDLSYSPRYKCAGGVSYKNPKLLDVDLTSVYNGTAFNDDANTQKVKQYCIWDVTMARKLTKQFSMAIKIENIFNLRYQEYRGTLAQPRTIVVSGRFEY